MDGRVQEPVSVYLRKRFGVDFVDTITEPGPEKLLAECKELASLESILMRLEISIERHRSVGIAIAAHYDCAGNPVSKEAKIEQVKDAMVFPRRNYRHVPVIGLMVDETWQAHEILLTENNDALAPSE